MHSTQSVSKGFQFFHILLSIAILAICFGYIFIFDNLTYNCSSFSPTLWLMFACEMIKNYANKSIFCVEENIRDLRWKKKKETKNKLRDFVLTIILTLITIVIIAFLCIILGAPVLQSHEQTLTLSMLITFTTILPVSLFLGPVGALNFVFSDFYETTSSHDGFYLDLLKRNCVFVLLGAYTGSIVSPLDWDRDWQLYPNPNIIGALIGYLLSNVYSLGKIFVTPWINNLKKQVNC